MNNNKVIYFVSTFSLCSLILICYADVFQWMLSRYISPESYYSHGFLVPIVSLFLIWQSRDRLQNVESKNFKLGLIIVCLSLLLHILGTILYVYSVSGFSLFLLIIGLILFLFGSQVTRILAFPLIFLIFMFPVPMAFISIISFPLKMLAAKGGVWIVSLLGVPVLQEGFNISIPAGHLIVGNPCSGLRSLLTFLALGAIFAYLSPLTIMRKWILFFFSIPIALLSNIVRIPILILVSNSWGLEAAAPDTFVHTGSGLLVFVLGFFLLLITAKALEWRN